ncbi:hypothetical protein AB2M62_08680 [Sphingomonas sp. MMS12-HWE2-04]|uniref:hypothetical protein n=1 Tax=Sphingomonas sp. MMS12-HWE2-04 TaxID=3234199 RepID=UPI00384CE8CB
MITHVRAKSVEEFGDLLHHSCEEFIHIASGRIVIHTEVYDPMTLEAGDPIYIGSNMGHAYDTATAATTPCYSAFSRAPRTGR